MARTKQNPPPPKPEEESSSSEEDEEEVEEEEGHPEKPQHSSSSGEEDEGEEQKTESDEEEEQPIPLTQKIQPFLQDVKKPSIQRQSTPPPPPAAPPNPASDEEEEEETEPEEEEEDYHGDKEEAGLTNVGSESPYSPTASDYTVRPIAVPVISKGSRPTPKRPLGASKEDGKGSGTRKKAKTGEEDEKKGKGAASAGRIWSEENEVVVLQGLIDFQKRKGPLRSANMEAFHEFIKGKLWEGVTKNQISDKVKRFRGKYFANVKKGKNGEDPSLSKPHEKKTFDLSKRIWGGGCESNGVEDKAKVKSDNRTGKKGGGGGARSEINRVDDNAKVKSDNPKGKKGCNGDSILVALMDVDENAKQNLSKDNLKDDEKDEFLSKFPNLSKSFSAELGLLKDNLHLIGSKKARELEEKWKQLRVEEMDVVVKRLNMMAEQTKLVLDAMKRR